MSMRSSASVTVGAAGDVGPRTSLAKARGRAARPEIRGLQDRHQPIEGAGDEKGIAIGGPRRHDLGCYVTQEGDNQGCDEGAEEESDAAQELDGEDAGHSGRHGDEEVLQEDDGGKETVLIGAQPLNGLRPLAALFRQVLYADAVGADYGDLNDVDDGVGQYAEY